MQNDSPRVPRHWISAPHPNGLQPLTTLQCLSDETSVPVRVLEGIASSQNVEVIKVEGAQFVSRKAIEPYLKDGSTLENPIA